jgi:Uma2 family endonuclease
VIEVSGDSLPFDRQTKASLYARARIPEHWIVNIAEKVIEVHREPDPTSGGYRQTSTCRSGETLTAGSVKDLHVDVATLFP